MTAIPFLTPRLPDPDLVARDYEAIVASGVFTNSGPVEQRFAATLERWIGPAVAVSVISNATTGIQLASKVLFHPDRPFALVASFTAAAGPLALRWSGFEPVLIDIDPTSWQPDLEMAQDFMERRGDQVAGILLTNTFGTANAAIDGWESLAQRSGVALILDSAPGFASRYPWGEPLGSRGDCEVFSFHATKTVAIGEGGAIASRNLELIERFNRLKNFGFDDDRRSQDLGLNAKLPELASAIGLRQLDVLAKRMELRREVHSAYIDELQPMGGGFQPGVLDAVPAFVSLRLPAVGQRDEVGCALARAGVGWRSYFNPPVHRQPSFSKVRLAGDLPRTEDLANRIISLPLDDWLSADDVQRVSTVIRGVIDAS